MGDWWQASIGSDCIADLPDKVLQRVSPLINLIFVCCPPMALLDERDRQRLRSGRGLDLRKRKFTEILNLFDATSGARGMLSLFSRADLQMWGIDCRGIQDGRWKVPDRPPRSYRTWGPSWRSSSSNSYHSTSASVGIGWYSASNTSVKVAMLKHAGIKFGDYDYQADQWASAVRLEDVMLLAGMLMSIY
jgi:hypothetical protein